MKDGRPKRCTHRMDLLEITFFSNRLIRWRHKNCHEQANSSVHESARLLQAAQFFWCHWIKKTCFVKLFLCARSLHLGPPYSSSSWGSPVTAVQVYYMALRAVHLCFQDWIHYAAIPCNTKRCTHRMDLLWLRFYFKPVNPMTPWNLAPYGQLRTVRRAPVRSSNFVMSLD